MIRLLVILAWLALSVYVIVGLHKVRTKVRSDWMTAMRALKKEYEK